MKTITGVRIPDVNRHRPESHPVVQRAAIRERLFDKLPPISAMEQVVLTSHIEHIAQGVIHMPDSPLTPQQRRSLLVIARELERRAMTPPPVERS